ncbi:MAG: aldo/keto reductase [Eubacteriales bacterium]|nr:aldo/keto reductase [Eubacteriales bacterium]
MAEPYIAADNRYNRSGFYRRCGNSGILLPRLSLGLWHNFGNITPFATQQSILRTAFDNGITHFDLANNYGPPYGEAERNFGIHMDRDWHKYRDELIISTKAGYDMWPGPYGTFGSRKSLIASADQSLKRMHLDYVDIFYHHRPDPDTPLEETMGALKTIVDSGRALYAGISNYPDELARKAAEIMEGLGTPLLICQSRYNLFNRTIENGLLDTLKEKGVGCIAFQPLSGGILTDKYIHGIPADSRAGHDPRYLKPNMITDDKIAKVIQLNRIATERGQTMAQLALQWDLRREDITSVLVGASRPEQISENLHTLELDPLTDGELEEINKILAQ